MIEALYKYVTAERALACLPSAGNGALRATQPAALNDPFECAVRPVFVINDEKGANQEFAEVLSSINGTTPVTAEEVAQARTDYGSLYLRNLFAKQMSQRFGIVSLSANPRHPLMWSHYTSDCSGFVVGYDAGRLGDLSGQGGSLLQVQYMNEMPLIIGYGVLSNPESNLLLSLAMKSDFWSYESEWRLIVELSETMGTGNRDPSGHSINLLQIPNEAVVSVYYTERTDPGVVARVRSRLENPNNRYGTNNLTKLVASSEVYGYEDAPEHDAVG